MCVQNSYVFTCEIILVAPASHLKVGKFMQPSNCIIINIILCFVFVYVGMYAGMSITIILCVHIVITLWTL